MHALRTAPVKELKRSVGCLAALLFMPVTTGLWWLFLPGGFAIGFAGGIFIDVAVGAIFGILALILWGLGAWE